MIELELIDKQHKALQNYFTSLKSLKDLNILINQKDFTSQLGEWIIAELYGAKLATNGKQKDWDMKINNELIQVKSHAKATTTKREDTDFKYKENAEINTFVIVVFNDSYKLKNIYKLPWNEAFRLKTISEKNPVIRWKDIEDIYKLNLEKIAMEKPFLKIFLK